jgi:oligopeptide/dipeptide ABC transporter ATP-binding protein
VLFKGMVAESGLTSEIVENPKHPYVQELIASIPIPDPDAGWQGTVELSDDYSQDPKACAFYGRCRYRKAQCLANEPVLYNVGGHEHKAACFLFEKDCAESPDFKHGRVLI